MSFLRIIFFVFATLMIVTPAPAEPAQRQEHAARIKQAIRNSGVVPSARIDEKLSSMSDQELGRLAAEQENIGGMSGPLLVIAGAICALFLLVTLLVKKVE